MKIIFNEDTRTFSVSEGNVKGKLDAVYLNGQKVNVGGSAQFRTDGIKDISGKGSITFGRIKCKSASFRGKSVFDSVECAKFEASGAISCESIKASKASIAGSGEIGSVTTGSASISNVPYSSSLPVVSGVASYMSTALGANGPLHIKSLVCNSVTIDGDVTIDVLQCKGKCTIKGDNVKILRRTNAAQNSI